MIITIPWLKEHLKTTASESEIIIQLTNIGLEVEGIKENSGEMRAFKVAKILKVKKHPNADKLKVCDVSLGGKEILKVVCGAPNAREGLLTIYAPPGAVIPKTNFELKIAKIRGVESRGMLCSESELNLSSESDGIIELTNKEKMYQLAGEGKCVAFFEYERMTLGIVSPDYNFDPMQIKKDE